MADRGDPSAATLADRHRTAQLPQARWSDAGCGGEVTGLLPCLVGPFEKGPDQVERLVSLRMEHQRRLLSDTGPLRFTSIIEEAVLRPTDR
jgi:hypothetical protein